jgi:hypothetical protein
VVGKRSGRRSSLSTLFEVRARKPFVYLALFVAAAALTWALVH